MKGDALGPKVDTVVPVESDRSAVEALGRRRVTPLDGRVAVMATGGVTNIRHFVERYGVERDGPTGLGLRLTGLCDAGDVERVLERCGLPTRGALDAVGFFVCDSDLEDEWIGVIGCGGMERFIATQGEPAAFRTSRGSRTNTVDRSSGNSAGSSALEAVEDLGTRPR